MGEVSTGSVNLNRFVHQNTPAGASGEFTQVLLDIVFGIKAIRKQTAQGALLNIGSTNDFNIHGEQQQQLDQIAHTVFKEAMTEQSGQVAAIVSEEDEGIIDTHNQSGKYIVAIDPLDGSGNIAVNGGIGTIFSVYQRLSKVGSAVNEADILQAGHTQVLAGYALYGPSTLLVYGTEATGVQGFTYDPAYGDFFLTHSNMRFPEPPTICSINAALVPQSNPSTQAFLQQTTLNARYAGAFVMDFHRILCKGGIFIYPSTTRHPKGKLRLLYEANPMAMLSKWAGGLAVADAHICNLCQVARRKLIESEFVVVTTWAV